MLLRPVLEAVADGLVRGRPHLVRPPRLEQLPLAERKPHVRPEVFVRRAEEDVDVPAGDVDRAVRPVVDGVGPGERADTVRKLDDPADVRRRSDRVRGDRKGDDAGSLGELALEVVEVERQILVHADEADDDPEVVLELEPGGDVRVVVELRHEHLVAARERSGETAREQEVERGHGRPERDLVGVAVEEATRRDARALDQLHGAHARLVRERRCSRCPRAGSARSRRSPRPGTGCRPARRRTQAAGRERTFAS